MPITKSRCNYKQNPIPEESVLIAHLMGAVKAKWNSGMMEKWKIGGKNEKNVNSSLGYPLQL